MSMGSNTGPENGEDGRIGPVLEPDCGGTAVNIIVSHGSNEHKVAVPSNSSFGDLKSVIVQKIGGLEPEKLKLLFRGKEKEDDENLQIAGVKDNSKVLLVEDMTSSPKIPEEVKETSVVSRGGEAVAEVRGEVDKLSDQISALQAVVDSGTKVDTKDIIYLTEMLMRQLLKLDGIEAEGEGKVQRKMEVRRVQSLVETMDTLKSRNSNPFINGNSNVSVTTQWETFEPGTQTVSAPCPIPSAPTPIPFHTPNPSSSPTPIPFHTPNPSSSPTQIPLPAPNPPSSPTPIPFHTRNPSSSPPQIPFPTPNSSSSPTQFPFPTPVPSSSPTRIPFPTPVPSFAPSPIPSSGHSPVAPLPVPSSAPSHMPSSTKVTHDWEHFD